MRGASELDVCGPEARSAPSGYVILSTQRAGSHLLGDILGSHPEFAQAGEVLMPSSSKPGSFDVFVARRPARQLSSRLWRSYRQHLAERRPAAKYVGMLVKYDHVTRIGGRDLISDSGFVGTRIMHLVRRNVLRLVVSHHLAVARNVHVARQEVDTKVNSVAIPPQRLIDMMSKRRSLMEEFRIRLADRHLTVELEYQDLMSADQTTSEALVERLCKFFEVSDEFTRTPPTIKLAPMPLDQLLDNYEEIAEALEGTEFEYMLERDSYRDRR